MATLYVRSTDGSDTDDGSTWALAKATLAGAYAIAAAGDTILVSQAHAEVSSTAHITLTAPGTAANPVKVLCVNDSTGALADTASISTTTASYNIYVAGFAYYYGITFNMGTGAETSYFSTNNTPNPLGLTFDNCKLYLIGTNVNAAISLNTTSTISDDMLFVFKNCTFGFNALLHEFRIGGKVQFIGCTLSAYNSTYPTTLFGSNPGCRGTFLAYGCDFSALGSGKNLVKGSGSELCDYTFSHCKLGAGVTILADAIAGPGGVRVYLDACDSGDPSEGPRSEAHTYQGSVKTDTAVYRTGGMNDGTPYSLKMSTNASGVSFISPLVTRPLFKVAGTTGSAITVTAEIIQADGSTALDESECWMEVEYMGTAGSTLSSFVTDHNSTLISASTTDQTTSTETWTGLTGTPVKQKLSCTFTPQEKGYYMTRIYLARASAVVYVCPKLTVS